MSLPIPPEQLPPPHLPFVPLDYHLLRRAHLMLGEVIQGKVSPMAAKVFLERVSMDVQSASKAL